MYNSLLFLHSWMRWVALALGAWALARAYLGWVGRRRWGSQDAAAGRWFTISMDLQFLVGLLLYGLFSPITTQAFGDMAAAMSDPGRRFFTVEHPAMMIAAVVLTHVGSVRARRAPVDGAKYRLSAIFYTLALLAVIASIPWPFMAVGRPLFPVVP